MITKIEKITARQILDSRGFPTIEASVYLSNKKCGTASVPSGASTGSYEAHELRDNDSSKFIGKGTEKAVKNVNNIISPALSSLGTVRQRIVDNKMISLDGTSDKSALGANSILAVSLALARACANSDNMPLFRHIGGLFSSKMPIPMMNILNGGAHAKNNLDVQEFMIVPLGFDSFNKALMAGCEIYYALKEILENRGLSTAVGDEGGFAPNLKNDEEAIELIIEAICLANYDTDRVKIALDAASSEWYENGKYHLNKSNEFYSTDELISKWEELIKKYPHYVPTYRVEHKLGTAPIRGKGNIEVTQTVKKATGSLETLEDFELSISRLVQKAISASNVNILGNALVNAAEANNNTTYIKEVSRDKADNLLENEELEQPKNNQISIYRNGERITYAVTHEVFLGFDSFKLRTADFGKRRILFTYVL